MLIPQFQQKTTALALDDLTRQRSWAQYHDNVFANVERLAAMGIKPGEHVALLMRNRVEYIEIITACFFAGVWVTPINWHLTDVEINYIIADSNSRLLFSEQHFRHLADDMSIPVIDVDRDTLAPPAQLSLATLDLEAQPGAIMFYTSGTTGRPKGVKRARAGSIQQMLDWYALSAQAIGLDGKGPHLVTGPLYHAAPLLFAIFDLYKGATLMIMPRFDARQALELLAQRQVRHSHWVPTMFTRALAFRDSFPDGFSELEFALHGAAPIGDQLKYEMLSWWGPKLHEYWGSTESGTVTLAKAGEWLAHPGTVGRAIGPFSVQAVDESGQVLPAGEQGRLCIEHKSLSQPFRYHQAQDKTEASYLGPGRFLIGDIGKVDEQGYVYLLDRDSHMIISGGVNIYPAEIEQVLLAHPAVADVAVFGIPNDEWGEEVKAVVELMPGYDHEPALAEDLLLSCRQQLAGYKVPRSIDFSEQLPRYESGKLYMLRLKAPYWQGRD